MVPIAHASDGGGSIRIPASCCGLIGLKPSQGRITLGPVRSEAGLSVELAVTRTVRDTARLLDAVAGPGIGDTVVAPLPTRPIPTKLASTLGGFASAYSTITPTEVQFMMTASLQCDPPLAQLEALGPRRAARLPVVHGRPVLQRPLHGDLGLPTWLQESSHLEQRLAVS